MRPRRNGIKVIKNYQQLKGKENIMKAFEMANGWAGYVHELMIINGKPVFMNDQTLKGYLEEYYDSEVVFLSDTEAPDGWSGTPAQWAKYIPAPDEKNIWWEGRLSLEEDMTDEDGSHHSGRQPRMEITTVVLKNNTKCWGLMF